ncbi:MAG TPA: CBS domain-containing protein [Longimicrobiales bacterium]|nr:CBS domain-containing protein [Longimicrobiales bacterium]
MKISELLTPDRVRVGLSAPTVVAAALTLVDALEAAGDLEDADALRERIRTGGARDIVDVDGGIALPHYRTTAAARLGLALAVLDAPTPVVEGPAGEGRDRARIVALVAAPPDASALHLQAVSTLARALVAPGLVERVLEAPDADAVVSVLGGTALPIKRHLKAGDVMSREYASVSADAHLRVAAERMLDGRSRAIPVVGDKGEVLGMVSSRDVLGALLPDLGRDEEGEATRGVREIMSRSVLCVPEDLPVTDVANMMINKHVEQVPVVREGRLVGVLTRTDIIRTLFAR